MILTNRYVTQVAPGKFAIRKECDDWKPTFLTIAPSDQVLPAVVPATGSYTFNVSQPQFDSSRPTWVILNQLILVDATDGASSVFTVQMQDNGHNRNIVRAPLHVKAVFGSAQTPGFIYEPLILSPNSSLRCITKKISGGAVNIYPYWCGYEYVGSDIERVRRILTERQEVVWGYWMTPDIDTAGTTISLAANATVEYITQNSSHSFQGLSLVGKGTGNFSVEIMEGRTRRALSNGSITLNNALGTGNYPHKFDAPFLIQPGASIKWKIKDLSGSSNNISVGMQGKLFNAPMKNIPQIERDLMIPADMLRVF